MKRGGLLPVLVVVLTLATTLRGFVFIESVPAWPNGTVTLELQLGSSPVYTDGTTPNSTAIQAINAWNPSMSRVQLNYVNNSGAAKSKTNGKNNVFFSDKVYGTAFGNGVLAVTLGRATSTAPIEMDVVVNNQRSWDSYRGYLRTKLDLRRVLIHEIGHVLGLDHPDDHGQWISAIMNSHISDDETTLQDDKDGASARYGRGPGNPAEAPTITQQPWGASVVEGQGVYFYAYASGTQPITYQWYKDDVAIAGATDTQFSITSTTLTDAGKYKLKATNDGGSATSSEATLTVTAAQAPTFNSHPQDTAVEIGATLSLQGWASSNAPISYYWTHDNEVVAGQTGQQLYISDATEALAGEYRLVATTAGGTATSNVATVTVVAAKPPVFSSHPTSGSAIVGQSFSLYAYANSALPLTYQWTHDGVVIPGATWNSHSIYTVTGSDAGEYRLIATNAAGSTSSNGATLTINPMPPPAAIMLHNTTVQVGSSFQFYVWNYNSGLTTYQWYQNGSPIPGATSSYFSRTATFADAGEYFVVATNAAGSTTSTTAIVTVTGTNTIPPGGWRQVVTRSNVAYFLFENPARIERFDMATESWLSAVQLPRTPIAMAVTDTGSAYVAFYRAVSRVNTSTGTETPLATLDSDVWEIAEHAGRLYVIATGSGWGYRRLGSILLESPGTQQWSGTTYYVGRGLSIDHTHGKAFTVSDGISPSDIASTLLKADGSFGPTTDSPYHGSFNTGSRTWVNPDDTLVFDNGGAVYSTADLTYVGNVGGPFESIDFNSDGSSLLLRGRTVTRFNTTLTETGTMSLVGDAHHLAVHGTSLFAFTQPSGAGSTIMWKKRDLSEISDPSPLPTVQPGTLDYTPEDVLMDNAGNILLYSRLHGNVFRWSVTEQRYLAPIPLLGRPNATAYASDTHRLHLGYADGRIRYIDIDDSTQETHLVSASNRVNALCQAADYVVAGIGSSSGWSVLGIYDVDGTQTDSRESYWDTHTMAWNASRSRVYRISNYGLAYNEITAGGKLGESREASYSGSSTYPSPIRFTPGGDNVLLGNGKFYNADTFVQNNELPHGLLDAAWLGNVLYTVRDTLDGVEIKRWGGSNYGQDGVRKLSGRTLRLFSVGTDRLLLVSQKSNRTAFTLLDASLTVKTHFENEPDLTINRLANLSTRAEVGTGDNIMIAGFVVSGSGPKRVLIRAVGPTLRLYGVSGELEDPMLRLVRPNGESIASNDDWYSTDGEALSQAFSDVGAFGLPEDSRDAALIAELTPGSYTAQVTGKAGTQGVALVEAYDLDAEPGERRLVNISTRALVGTGAKVLIPGFVVEGLQPKLLLIRAVGPTLAAHGVSGALADPQVNVMNSRREVIYSNDNWESDNAEVTIASSSASGAFALPSGSRDAALVVSLPPGAYTVVVSGVNDTTGVALVEVYEVR